jgi:hypothetical protein
MIPVEIITPINQIDGIPTLRRLLRLNSYTRFLKLISQKECLAANPIFETSAA